MIHGYAVVSKQPKIFIVILTVEFVLQALNDKDSNVLQHSQVALIF